jgi:hypothetical protein
MATQWIENLAQEIKQKNHEAAEKYGREQHTAGIIERLGKEYFVALAICLQENVAEIRRHLQGDSTAAETVVETIRPDEIRLARSRFPWVDARVQHRGETITLDYAKGAGVQGDEKIDRKTRSFALEVAADDSLFAADAFADAPEEYKTAEALARKITELLFSA